MDVLPVPWNRRLSTKFGVIACLLIPVSFALVGAAIWSAEEMERETASVTALGIAQQVNAEQVYVAHRLFWRGDSRESAERDIRRLMQRADARYAELSKLDTWGARLGADLPVGSDLESFEQRWRETTRPQIERLLGVTTQAQAKPLLDELSKTVALEATRLNARLLRAQSASHVATGRLQLLHAAYLGVLLLTLCSLLWLVRSVSVRARALVTNSQRLLTGELQLLPQIPGADEISAASETFSSAVSRIRLLFESEREALERRLEAVASMNSALAADAPGFVPAGSNEPVPGIVGSVPPSLAPPSIAPPQHAPSGAIRTASQFPARGPKRVLLVDDDPAVVRGFARILRSDGYEVDTATSAVAALSDVKNGVFDVIVSDIAMPDMDGIQFLRKVRDRDLLVPVILATGKPAVSTAAEAVELGAFQYLVKPVEKESFRRVVEHASRVHEVARTRQHAAELLGQGMALGADRAGLEGAFDRALESLWVAYQPIVDMQQRNVFGYEALLRSREPKLPHPGAVLDAAERLGQLERLGRTVRGRAAVPMLGGQLAALPSLFVNLHVRDLLDPSLLDPEMPLSQIASRVVLEITERSSLEEVRDARTRVAQLREMGFRIAVDDMGAGYAGLSSFALLEPEIVKLDMSLIRDINRNATKQKVIRSMATLCEDMRIQVIAEGVETREERDALVDLGCRLLQGYLFARPGEAFPAVHWDDEDATAQGIAS